MTSSTALEGSPHHDRIFLAQDAQVVVCELRFEPRDLRLSFSHVPFSQSFALGPLFLVEI